MRASRSIFQSIVVLLAFAQLSRSLEVGDFYDFERTVRLENGDDKYELVKLDTPINFFSDIYDEIYINTLGILTFKEKVTSFLNVPIPLEYASIAPFYSHIDTTAAGPETSISFSQLSTERNIRLAHEAVRRNFAVNENFRVVNVAVATWENVGHYRANNTAQNTFQVAIICGEQDTFVEFLYPSNGVNWLQGEEDDSGLPDIRAQSGFMAEDGRFFTLTGSGTENAKYLSQLSNNDKPGSWIYRIGHLEYEQNIEEPEQTRYFRPESQYPRSCESGGKLKCHTSAICHDARLGFNCECKHGFYGNGFNCIKNDVPLRAAGKVTGKINNVPVDAHLQSYVVLSDGRSYTAVSPIDKSIGHSSQFVFAFGSVIGWLFAKPVANDNAPNGYQLTGGNLNHTTTIRFSTEEGTKELLIVQRFTGLNHWDQLAVDIEVNGNLPPVREGSNIELPDSTDYFEFVRENHIQSNGNGEIIVDGQNITYTINQLIEFETFRERSGDPLNTYNTQPLYNKVLKITAQYQDQETALRIGMINKVLRNAGIDPCNDGTATCQENAFCIPDPPNDSYYCECKNGFFYDDSSVACVDIDECITMFILVPCDVENSCHQNANCEWVESELRNRCVCNPGYEGNGYECTERETSCLFENICDVHASCAYDELIGKSVCKCNKKYEGDGKSCQLAPECVQTEDCSENSNCSDGVCVCNEGYERDIADYCVPNGFCGGTFCATNAVCLLDTVQNVQYCSCPEGYNGDGLRTCKSVPPSCNIKNNCGLNAQCVPNSDNKYECACNSGFYGDGFICVPEINCSNVPSLCHEQGRCISTKSGYQCICNAGYIGNGSYCTEPVRQGSAFLLLSQGVAIVKIPTDGTKRASPISMSGMAIGIDKDCSTGRVFWSDISSKQIFSSMYDGTDKKVFISEDIVSPEGIAIDWISRRIYWTDSSKDTIEVASLDNSKLRAIVVQGNLVNPRGIAVDPHQNKLYWSDWNRENPKIEQSDLDGTNRVTLLQAPAINLPNSLSISSRTGEVCFADAGTQKIECIEPYSRQVRTVATNLEYPFGLTVTNDRLYWTDWTTKKIESSDDQGSRFASIANPLFGNHKMYGVAAVSSECPIFFSQCQINNGDCPSNSICLINPNAPSGQFCKPTSQ